MDLNWKEYRNGKMDIVPYGEPYWNHTDTDFQLKLIEYVGEYAPSKPKVLHDIAAIFGSFTDPTVKITGYKVVVHQSIYGWEGGFRAVFYDGEEPRLFPSEPNPSPRRFYKLTDKEIEAAVTKYKNAKRRNDHVII